MLWFFNLFLKSNTKLRLKEKVVLVSLNSMPPKKICTKSTEINKKKLKEEDIFL